MKHIYILLVFLIFIFNQNGFFAALTGTKLEHPRPKGFATINGIEYYISEPEEADDALHAVQFCNTFLDMSLASLDTEEKNLAVKDYLVTEGLGDEYFWTSGRRMVGWVYIYTLWSATGFMMNYTDLATPIDVTSPTQMCFLVQGNSGWHNDNCTSIYRFMCQKYIYE